MRAWVQSVLGAVGLAVATGGAAADEIGSVDTAFQWLGPNHKIVVEAFDDPKIDGVSCHISRSKTGGIKGGLGLAEERSEASVACRQVGPIVFKKPFREGEEVFEESRSLLFKRLQVVRFYDAKRHTLVYLAYSDKLIDGSPQNAISTVPVMAWPENMVRPMPLLSGRR
ncbi:MAG: hypothetical protein FJX67_12720 [Alphaproteobacteria bacterium]|nr:hypothetical protein [Alphaproteobacteria bacterium]